jgi:hypothetical protein
LINILSKSGKHVRILADFALSVPHSKDGKDRILARVAATGKDQIMIFLEASRPRSHDIPQSD